MSEELKQHSRQSINKDAPPPAYFLSLEVENIRCFGPKQTLDLTNKDGRPAPWTIILGDNGFGKTTLLQCLAGLQPVPRRPRENAGVSFEPYYLSDMDKMNYLTDKTVRSYPALIESSIKFGAELSDLVEGNKFSFSIEPVRDRMFGFNAAELDKGEHVHGLICYGYGAARRMGEGSLSERKESDTTTSLFSDDATLINAEEWYLQADYSARRSNSSKARRQRDQIKQALIKILPDVEDIRIAEPKGSDLGARVEIKTPFGWVHIQSLSFGYRALIAWVVDFAHRLFQRYPNHKNPLAQPAVVLVDEIDLHLHPRFQRILMDYLTEIFPNTQFIATAHSPLVVQAASNANIALLRREGDHVVIDNDVEAIKNWRIDQILTSELFGLESARAPHLDPLLEERTRILSKAKLTKADEARLKKLEAEIGDLPTGETPADMEAMDIIREAARLLKSNKEKSK